MDIDYREERTDDLPDLESASLKIVGVACLPGPTELLAEAACRRLRADGKESADIRIDWADGQPDLEWDLGEEAGYLMPYDLFERLVAWEYAEGELLAARAAVVRARPELDAGLPEEGARLCASVAGLQRAIAAGPPAWFAIDAAGGDSFSSGEVWAGNGPEAEASLQLAAFRRVAGRFGRLVEAVGEERARRICGIQEAVLSSLTLEQVAAIEGAATACEFRRQAELLRFACRKLLGESGALDGLAAYQRELALDLVRNCAPSLMAAAIGRISSNNRGAESG